MILKDVTIRGYRSFAEAQTLRFATPSGSPGSGLTLVVGPNGSGKSSVIEVIQFLSSRSRSPSIEEGQKNAKTNGDIHIVFTTPSEKLEIRTGPAGIPAWHPSPPSTRTTTVYTLPPRRIIEPAFGITPQDRSSYLEQAPDFSARRPYGSNFPSRLVNIDSWKDLYFGVLRRILPSPPNWYLARSEQGNYYLNVTSGTSPHRSDGLGSGTTSAIHVADALYDSKPNDLIALDEPELSLHPAAQRRLCDLIVELSADRQIIIATHSPFLVPLELLGTGMQVARLYHTDTGTQVGQLSANSMSALSAFLGDRNNPHVLGLDARESVFLEDNVILVEGQDDVLGYRRLLTPLKAPCPPSFFGWGVGGASKMLTIAQMLRELGLRRVVGILDKGKESELAALKAAFPEYHFEIIPTPDLRGKPARPPSLAQEGLLDATGHVRPEHAVYIESLRAALTAYFAD